MTTLSKMHFEPAEPNYNVLLNAVDSADSVQVLNFLGELIKLHIANGREYTKEERNIRVIRNAWVSRMEELKKAGGEDQ